MDPNTFFENIVSTFGEATNGGAGIVIGAIQVLVIAIVVGAAARLARRSISRGLANATDDPNIAALGTNLAVAGIYLLGMTLILGVFGASWSAMLAVIGAGTIALSLALQDLLKSYVAGIYLLVERPFAVGDWILVKDVEGEVESIDLRTTHLRTRLEERVTVPNATVFAEVVTNRSAKRDDRITVTLSKLSEPLGEIHDLVRTALARVDGASDQSPVIEIVRSTEDGASVSVTLFHPPGEEMSARVLTRLRDAFPKADLDVERG
ncbi:MAG: mechanosensitive ion channel family protein [Chloroflexota bacterium]|nr:mechanosensitive ion channel family protein [Chloroflexota bacterium]